MKALLDAELLRQSSAAPADSINVRFQDVELDKSVGVQFVNLLDYLVVDDSLRAAYCKFASQFVNSSNVLFGAVLWGRLFSKIARYKIEVDFGVEGTIDPRQLTYDSLVKDEYFDELKVAVERVTNDGGPPPWDFGSEVFHFSRGVETFFVGFTTVLVGGDKVKMEVSVERLRDALLELDDDDASRKVWEEERKEFDMVLGGDGIQRLFKYERPDLASLVKVRYVKAHLMSTMRWMTRPTAVDERKRSMPTFSTAAPTTAAASSRAGPSTATVATVITTPHVARLREGGRIDVFKQTPLAYLGQQRAKTDLFEEGEHKVRVGDFEVPVYFGSASAPSGLQRVFHEVRRLSTLRQLMHNSGDFHPNASFLELINAGTEANGFVFPKEYEWIRNLCENSRALPKSDLPATGKTVVDHTIVRVSRGWSGQSRNSNVLNLPRVGMHPQEDVVSIVNQYVHGAAHGVGVGVGAVVIFPSEELVDKRELWRWSVLSDQRQLEDSPDFTAAAAAVGEFKTFLLEAGCRTTPLNDEENKRYTYWFRLLFDTTADSTYVYNDRLDSYVASGEDDAAFLTRRVGIESWLKMTPSVAPSEYDPQANVNDEHLRIWLAVQKKRVSTQFVELGAKPPPEDLVRLCKWFSLVFGIGVAEEARRRLSKRTYTVPTLKQDTRKTKTYGMLFLNERMLFEIGKSGAADENSIIGKIETVRSVKTQQDLVSDELSSLWELLTKMSSAGILNTDAHLGNYLLTTALSKENPNATARRRAKIIDFDAKTSRAFLRLELMGESGNTEGWKPLFVLNALLLLYTLSQDASRIQLYELFKNALHDPSIVGQFDVFESNRLVQFKDMVYETKRALEQTKASGVTLSEAQKLLDMSWNGGFKGRGDGDALGLDFYERPGLDAELFAAVRRVKDVPEHLKKHTVAFKYLQKLGATVYGDGPPANKAFQLDWAIRLNIEWRSHRELIKQIIFRWRQREDLVKKGLGYSGTAAEGVVSSTHMAEIFARLDWKDRQALTDANMYFETTFKAFHGPAISHSYKDRPAGYKLLDLLADYVFAPTIGRESALMDTAARYKKDDAHLRSIVGLKAQAAVDKAVDKAVGAETGDAEMEDAEVDAETVDEMDED